MKIVIIIEGGVLHSTFASSADVEVELIDVDNLLGEGKSNVEIDALIEAATGELFVV